MTRVCVIGFGLGGRGLHAPLVSSVEGLELAAVVERTSSRAAERYPGIATPHSVEDALADTSIGLFVVTTPSGTHYEIARQILEAGRSVVVDKPVCPTSAEVAELMALAAAKGAHLIPFHNRRWDGDFETVGKLLNDGLLGRLVAFESRFDRWRPEMNKARLWKEMAIAGAGMLQDIGPHLCDQALVLFGKPEAVSAEVLRERDGTGSDDSFTIRLRYQGLAVTLGANSLSLPAGPRFHLRGTKGNYWKQGLDPQGAALDKAARVSGNDWCKEPSQSWGMLHIGIDGGMVSRPVEPIAGDYRLFYAGVRDVLLGKAHTPVAALDAWRVARVLEWAEQSSKERREIPCDWSNEPA